MIVIQGAGITGLTLAGLLERRGVDYRLVEQSLQLQPVGAGILLQRNALEVLAELPEADFDAVSTPIERMVVGSIEEPDLQTMELDNSTRARAVHRGDLQQFLLQQIDPSRLLLDSSVDGWEECESGLDVHLSSGDQLRAEVLVGADGISSGIRGTLAGPPRVRNSGQWCARTVISEQAVAAEAREIHAGRYRLGSVPLTNGRTYIFWVCSRHSGEVMENEQIENSIRTMGASGSALAAGFSPAQKWLQHPLTDIPVCWGEGRIPLVGDAAHALTPNLGQGAALGVEDAWVLAGLIDSGERDARTLAQQLREPRHARVRNVRGMSYFMGRVAHVEQPLLRRFRNGLLKTASPARSRAGLRRWLDQFSIDCRAGAKI